jgi:predicted nucleic acid-binding protein
LIIVDSSVWIANLRDLDTTAVRFLRSIEDPDDIIVGDLILLEVLQGARNEEHAVRIENGLRQFRVESMLDAELAVRAARHYRTLRDRGVTIRKTIDLIIGTFCLTRGYALLHDDRDFDAMAAHLGLRAI